MRRTNAVANKETKGCCGTGLVDLIGQEAGRGRVVAAHEGQGRGRSNSLAAVICAAAAAVTFAEARLSRADVVTLSGWNYAQSFDSLGTLSGTATLPDGWEVRTGATATVLGTLGPAVVKQTWGDNAKGFINTASATGLTVSTSATVQGSSTNRALGIRLASDFGDPGAAFCFNFSSLGHTLQSGAIDLMMLAVEGRSNTWSLQYGLGPSPTSFTTIATWSDPGVWGTTTLHFDAPSLVAMSNQPSVWFRVVALSSSTGVGSRDTVAIDNFQLTYLPEPSAAGLAAVGCLGLLAWQRRRARAS